MSARPVALVTGASRGIGAAIAERLADAGFDVALTYRSERERAERVVAGLLERGGRAEAFPADAHDSQSVRACVRQVLARLGRIDVLVNNIGRIRDGIAVGMREEFEDVVVTNLKSTFLFSHAVIRHMMKQRSGRIINVTSMVGRNPGGPGQCNYIASKAAIHSFTRSLAQEVANRGITVNAVAPGLVETDLSRALLHAKPAIVNAIPARRLGEKREVAALVAYLASQDAAYLNGEVVGITGGMCL